MADVFVSYSRKDKPLVGRLHEALRQSGRDTWVDWEGIPPTAEWMAEIRAAIESADNFVFVISPDSVASPICRQEADHAALHRKRLIPIVGREVAVDSVPAPIANLNWIFFTSPDAFDTAFKQLTSALDTDLDWVKEHTRFLVRALQWQNRHRNDAFLLRGTDLTAAEAWLAAGGAQKEMRPTQLQVEYITASRRGATKRLRILLASVILGAAVAITLAVIAFHQSNIAEDRRKEAKHNADLAEANAATARKNEDTANRNAARADKNAKTAEQRRKEAEEQRRIAIEERDTALSRELATNSLSNLPVNPELSLLLAREAARVKRTDQAEQTLRRALLESHIRLVMNGHTAPVTSVAFSEDGQQIITGSSDTTARIWDSRTGRLLQELKGHTGTVHQVAFAPDGHRAITVGDFSVRVWDADTGAALHVLKGDPEFQVDVALSPDGMMVAGAGRNEAGKDASLGHVWDLKTGKLIATLAGHTDALTSIRFTPDSRRLVSGAWDGTARVWDARTGQQLFVLKGHDEQITSLSISPDGQHVVTACWDKVARLWNLKDGKLMATLVGHEEPITTTAFSPNSRLIATAGRDGIVRVWSVAHRAVQAELRGHTGFINSVEFSRDGGWLVTSSDDGTARVWQASTKGAAQQRDPDMFDETKQVTWRNVAVLTGHRGKVAAAVFRRDAQQIATAGYGDLSVRVWDSPIQDPERTFVTDQEGKVAFSRDGGYLITFEDSSVGDDLVKIWSLSDNRMVAEPAHHAQFSRNGAWVATSRQQETSVWNTRRWTTAARLHGNAAQFSSDSKWLATQTDDQTLVWHAGTWIKAADIPGTQGEFSEDGIKMCSQSKDTIDVWGTDLWTRLISIPGTFSSQRCFFTGRLLTADMRSEIRFWDQSGRLASSVPSSSMYGSETSPDGTMIAHKTDELVIHDTRTGQLLTKLEPHGDIDQILFSPGNTYIAVALKNGVVRIWELRTWQTAAVLSGHRGEVHDLAFSPDEHFLATAGEDKSARIWDVATGQTVMELRNHAGSVSGIAFSPDGRRIATASEDKSAQVLRCEVCAPLDELLRLADTRVTRQLTGAERAKYKHELSAEREDPDTLLARGRQMAAKGDVSGAATAFEAAVRHGGKLYREPLLEARLMAAEELIARSTQHAERLEIVVAVEERRKAKTLGSGLVKDPVVEVGKIAGKVLSDTARREAEAGRIAVAEKILTRAEHLDPTLSKDNGPFRVREWAASPLRNEAYSKAYSGDRSAVAAILRKAAAIDPYQAKDPDQQAAEHIATVEKYILSDLDKVTDDYAKFSKLLSERAWVTPHVSAATWARVCSYNAVKAPAAVLPYCDRAVQLEPGDWWIRERRAFLRALMNDLPSAAEDMQAAVDVTEGLERKHRNEEILSEFRRGHNPLWKPGTREIDTERAQRLLQQ